MSELLTIIRSAAKDLLPQVTAIRRHLHANPELSFQEYNTAAFIAEQLDKLGISNQQGVAGTGIVAHIFGNDPESATVALRSDHDALPIHEQNNVEYRSKNDGVMHACGHDVHTACLLGAAMILNACRDKFSGTVKLVFQPGEEKLPGGASLMIAAGALKEPAPASIFAQHVFPSMECGKVGFRKGMYMASTDELYLTVKGKGGHAAMPSDYVNPLLIASAVLLELDKEFMKKKHDAPTVLAFGKIIGEGATNVIPAEVKLEGTFRTMNEAWRSEAHTRMQEIAGRVAEAAGGQAELRVEKGYPFLVNDDEVTGRAITAAESYLGKENVEELPLRMTAEDFAFYSQVVPSCFYRLGTGNKSKGITSGVHTATFDIDERALETGMGLMAWLTVSELRSKTNR